jgi:metallo-beta-lactamase class B
LFAEAGGADSYQLGVQPTPAGAERDLSPPRPSRTLTALPTIIYPEKRMSLSPLAIAATALIIATPAFATPPQPATATAKGDPPAWSEPFAPFHLAGPIHYVGTRGLGVYLVETGDGLILISGATPGTASLITDSVRKLGFDPKQVRLLLSSHAHFDHAGTTADLKRLTGAAVVAMAGDAELLASGGATDYLFADRPRFRFPPVQPDRLVKDGEVISLGGVHLTAHATPGHTRGCTTWELRYEAGGRTVDVVIADGTSVNPGTRLGRSPSYPGIAADYRRTFAVLEGLHPDVFLSYHAEVFGLEAKRERQKAIGEQAWVDPDGYVAFVRRKKAELERLVTAATADDKGKPGRTATGAKPGSTRRR